jgi:hypothetical protein
MPAHPSPGFKVFGIGLSRTGTQSLTAALGLLGFRVVHYPVDAGTLQTLVRGDARFPLLAHFDGLADITVAPYFAELSDLYPDSRFVLTLRERGAWLRSCEAHFAARPAFEAAVDPQQAVPLEIRRFLRAAVYGCHDFHPRRFALAYERHLAAVRAHFEHRPGRLLELDVTAGQGFERLAPFLGLPVPAQAFPHRGRAG